MNLMEPNEVVEAMCAEWMSGDAAAIAAWFTDDAVYHNMPMEPVVGPAAIEEFIKGMSGMFSGVEFTIRNQAVNGNFVLNERTDRFLRGDAHFELPVMGVFEVEGDKISAWRDYFDLAEITKALSI